MLLTCQLGRAFMEIQVLGPVERRENATQGVRWPVIGNGALLAALVVNAAEGRVVELPDRRRGPATCRRNRRLTRSAPTSASAGYAR